MEEFTQPGPGGWKRLADHFPDALTPEYQRLYAETCPPGMAGYMERYGVLARTLDIAFVHGHVYVTPVPLSGPREMPRTPPAALVWLLSRLHPAFRQRTKAARRTLDERPWRLVTSHWFEVERFEWSARCADVESLDPGTMSAEDFVAHLHACRSLVVAGYERHFELHGDDMLPIGLLFARCAEWGIAPKVAAQALAGASPLSAGTVEPAAWQIVTGYDLDCLAWCELVDPPSMRAHAQVSGRDLRDLVPEDCHGELTDLVNDARSAVPLRDDNGALTGAWPMGLLRRAMLEAGARLGLDDASLAVELTVDELLARLGGKVSPTASEIEERRAERARCSHLDAPLAIGPEFAIPPLAALPRPLALIGAAQLAAADNMMVSADHGIGVGTESYTGRALVVDDPSVALEMMEAGDVVITTATSPSWNIILAQAGAVITAAGGLMSHAAVIARELGIPGVIGDATACSRFSTGDLVTVDPVAGTCTVALTAQR